MNQLAFAAIPVVGLFLYFSSYLCGKKLLCAAGKQVFFHTKAYDEKDTLLTAFCALPAGLRG